MTTITALTAQNHNGVTNIAWTNPEFIKDSLVAVTTDDEQNSIDAVKVGMIGAAQTLRVVADWVQQSNSKIKSLVVDPVLVATSGDRLVKHELEVVQLYIDLLMPKANLITPNLEEACKLLSNKETGHVKDVETIKTLEELEQIAIELYTKTKAKAVLLKGGHFTGVDGVVADILYDGKTLTTIKNPRIESQNTHGTGCTLSSAIACNLADGQYLELAVRNGINYVRRAISNAYDYAHTNGPLNHNVVPPHITNPDGTYVEYLINHPSVRPHWDRYVNHPFVKQLADNTLPVEKFIKFVKQDYLYLSHYAHANALLAMKSDTLSSLPPILRNIDHERDVQVEYCKKFGISKSEMDAGDESMATIAYTRYIRTLDTPSSLRIGLSACLLGYREAALAVKDKIANHPNPMYKSWLETYIGDIYYDAVKIGLNEMNDPDLVDRSEKGLVKVFQKCVELEVAFWDAAL